LFDDANASSSIIDSFNEFSKKEFNDDTIHGMISTIQLFNQVSFEYTFLKTNFISRFQTVMIDLI